MIDTVEILEIGIEGKTLYITPKGKKFPYVYRVAKGVRWDAARNVLTMDEDRPSQWDLPKCFQQIMVAAAEQGSILGITKNTQWKNISEDIKTQILALKS